MNKDRNIQMTEEEQKNRAVRIPVERLLGDIKTLGRTFYSREEKLLYMNWTGSGIEFCWQGEQLSIEFAAEYNCEIEGLPWDENAPKRPTWPWFALFIDDMDLPAESFCVSEHHSLHTIISGADPSETHRIRIMKRTENFKTWGFIAAFLTDGKVIPPPASSKKKIEFIGDSITCGFGNGTVERDRLFYSEEENVLTTHGYLAAKELDMEPSFLSVSGIVATRTRSFPMEYTMDEIYDFTDKPGQRHLKDGKPGKDLKDEELERWDFDADKKDIIVVNLGTNDATAIVFSEDQEEAIRNFHRGYKAFIRNLREKNGQDSRIVCALGPMSHFLWHDICRIVEEYKEESSDSRIYTFRYLPISPVDGFGACGHPSEASHRKMAQELTAFLRQILPQA